MRRLNGYRGSIGVLFASEIVTVCMIAFLYYAPKFNNILQPLSEFAIAASVVVVVATIICNIKNYCRKQIINRNE